MRELSYKESVELHVASTGEQLARECARDFAATAAAAIKEAGRFAVALSGGQTPQALFACLAADYDDRIDWRLVHFFWADERPVPPTHERSNYRLAQTCLLDKVRPPAANIHRIKAELGPDAAASAYADELRQWFHLRPGEWPRFDLVLLGIGRDGHTASLFPGSTALRDTTDLVTTNIQPGTEEARITLTYPALNAARRVLVMASGKGKRSVVREALTTPARPAQLPIQGVLPRSGKAVWRVDQEAAAGLSQETP